VVKVLITPRKEISIAVCVKLRQLRRQNPQGVAVAVAAKAVAVKPAPQAVAVDDVDDVVVAKQCFLTYNQSS
jgi:hypothetical protein